MGDWRPSSATAWSARAGAAGRTASTRSAVARVRDGDIALPSDGYPLRPPPTTAASGHEPAPGFQPVSSVAASTTKGAHMGQTKWWGWGDEGVSFTHADKPALAPFLERAIGLDVHGEPSRPAAFDDI